MLPLVGYAIVLGVVIGLLLPPAARHLARPHVRVLVLVAAGASAQLIASQLDDGVAVVLAVIGFACLLAFAVANLHVIGMGVVAIGLGANLLVVLLNGGMPVRPRALTAAYVIEPAQEKRVELSGPRHRERTSDHLVVLGDIIPVPALHEVLSFGDLVVLVAVTDVAAHLARRRRRRQPLRPDGASTVHEEGEPGPRLGDGAEAGAVVRVPVLGEPRAERAGDRR